MTQIEHMFDTGSMSREEQQYMAGYNAGRTSALTTGSVDAGRNWLLMNATADSAYVAGYEWALWGYEDANGLAHIRRTNSATA